jgi:hypothetical protein
MMASVVKSQIEKKTPQFPCVNLKTLQNVKKNRLLQNKNLWCNSFQLKLDIINYFYFDVKWLFWCIIRFFVLFPIYWFHKSGKYFLEKSLFSFWFFWKTILVLKYKLVQDMSKTIIKKTYYKLFSLSTSILRIGCDLS